MLKYVISFSAKVTKKFKGELLNLYELLYYKLVYKRPNVQDILEIKRFIVNSGENFSEISGNFRKYYPDYVDEKIKQADLICEHVFDLLNSGPVKLSSEGIGYQPIDWHSDFKSGFKWNPSTFHRYFKFRYIEGVDIKVPWELSYFHHLAILGQAYLLSGNERYAIEFENQITDWIDNNKTGFGIGWACAMIIAIRAINWLVALEYFSERSISRDFLSKFYSSICEHGKFIRSHLEYSQGETTNHYLFNLAGLFFIAVYCPFLKESKSWQEFALNELHKEMEKQVYPDGCNFEASTSYHRFVLEMFFCVELIGKKEGIEFSENWGKKLRKMFEFSLYCIMPNGMIPQVGDNDSGRFLAFSNRPVLEHKYLLSFAAIYYKDSSFKLQQFELDEEAFWVFGKSAIAIWGNLPYRENLLTSKSFRDAGWYIIRDKNDYCFISCGYNGQNGNGGHAHNDKLSFELMLNGKSAIVDPGTYIYMSNQAERNKFRSTEYHNTIKFDDYEQNEFPHGFFLLPDRVKITNAELTEMDEETAFKGEIKYAGIVHNRKISLNKNTSEWQIADSFSFSDPVNARLSFHFSPSITIDGNELLRKEGREMIGTIEVVDYELIKDNYDYSPEYGVKIDSAERLTAIIPLNGNNRNIFTIIKPNKNI